MNGAALLLLLAALPAPLPASAQAQDVPAIAPAPAQAAPAPRREAPPRPRPRDPRDRAWMDGGIPGAGGFTGFGATVTAPPRPELAPRPNLDIEGPRASAAPRPGEPAIAPTLINPRLPGRNATQDTGATQRENRFLQTPAPGLRLTTPMAW